MLQKRSLRKKQLTRNSFRKFLKLTSFTRPPQVYTSSKDFWVLVSDKLGSLKGADQITYLEAETLQPSWEGQKHMALCEFRDSLGYIASSRPAKGTERDCLNK